MAGENEDFALGIEDELDLGLEGPVFQHHGDVQPHEALPGQLLHKHHQLAQPLDENLALQVARNLAEFQGVSFKISKFVQSNPSDFDLQVPSVVF